MRMNKIRSTSRRQYKGRNSAEKCSQETEKRQKYESNVKKKYLKNKRTRKKKWVLIRIK